MGAGLRGSQPDCRGRFYGAVIAPVKCAATTSGEWGTAFLGGRRQPVGVVSGACVAYCRVIGIAGGTDAVALSNELPA